MKIQLRKNEIIVERNYNRTNELTDGRTDERTRDIRSTNTEKMISFAQI